LIPLFLRPSPFRFFNTAVAPALVPLYCLESTTTPSLLNQAALSVPSDRFLFLITLFEGTHVPCLSVACFFAQEPSVVFRLPFYLRAFFVLSFFKDVEAWVESPSEGSECPLSRHTLFARFLGTLASWIPPHPLVPDESASFSTHSPS